MGYAPSPGISVQPLWRTYRASFPVVERLAYLNHAAVAPLARPAAEAMRWWLEDALHYGALHYSRWMEAVDGLRLAAARLIGCHPREIAVVKNTSEGISTVATGIRWRSGDVVVAFREEFPANYYPWWRLERNGVRVRWLSIFDPLDRIDEACRGARLLAISFVNYLNGYRPDLAAIGQICARHGTLFFVDAIQGLGAFPLNVREVGIHALAADGHKWLLGPEGCGILFVSQDVMEEIEPVEFGWMNTARWADYGARDLTLRPDAGRYECGTLNTVGCCGLKAAIEFLLEVGVERIADAILQLTFRLIAGVRAKGYRVCYEGPPERLSGIVSFQKAGVDSRQLVQSLRQHDIVVAERQQWIRVSPHFYNSPEEIDRLLDLLP